MPVGKDEILKEYRGLINLCADESSHGVASLALLKDRYSHINIKLDKTGGFTGALQLLREAQNNDFGIMIGCMVASSLAMAPAVVLGLNANFVDLDGPLLLAQDRSPALQYEGSQVFLPKRELWG